jgi:hypothetical protein
MDIIDFSNDIVFNYVATIMVHFSIPLLTTVGMLKLLKEALK